MSYPVQSSDPKQEARSFFQTQVQPGEALLNDLDCAPNAQEQPPVGSPAAEVTVSFFSTCQIEVYDRQGSDVALLSAAHQLASRTLDSHFTLARPLQITIITPGAAG